MDEGGTEGRGNRKRKWKGRKKKKKRNKGRMAEKERNYCDG
jgi:hypothetical protein